MTTIATQAEVPMFLRAAGEDIFAILTTAAQERHRGEGVVLLQGGSWTPSPGRNRLWVEIARELADDGYDVVRLDYRGVGESSGAIDNYSLDEPFVEEVAAAAEALRAVGCERLILLGTCFGARTAMAAAPAIPGITGMALFPAPVRDFQMGDRLASLPTGFLAHRALSGSALRGVFDPVRRRAYARLIARKVRRGVRRVKGQTDRPGGRFEWVSPLFVDQLEAATDTGIHVLLVFGSGDDFYRDFQRGRAGRLGKVLDRAGSLVEVREVPGKLHGLTTVQVQTSVRGLLTDWLIGDKRGFDS